MGLMSVYTVGYGNRTIQEFIGLLQQYRVRWLVDVRSRPYSRFKPEFSRESLERGLRESGIHYVFMGDTLGGLPDDETCYTGGRVDYDKYAGYGPYLRGISRLCRALRRVQSVALMCSESKPQDCHRSKLIGETLVRREVKVVHIDESGAPRTQEEVVSLLTGGQQSLFGPAERGLRSRRRTSNGPGEGGERTGY